MSKIAVIYWSGTGNTQQMAEAIANQAHADLFTASEFSPEKAANYDAFAFGCSAMGLCACVHHEESGRTMEVITDQPGVQFYTACTTDYADGKGGMHYLPYSALCLETQHYPDSPNHPNFPTTTLRPGEIYDTTTIYAFRVDA